MVAKKKASTRKVGKANAATSTGAKLAKLVPAWFEAWRDMDRISSEAGSSWLDEEPMASFLGRPCAAREVTALERSLGRPLPSSYRAYLSLFGSKKKGLEFPLGAAQHAARDVKNELRERSDLFDEFGKDNPIEAGAIPFLLDEGSRQMVLLVPPMRADGEMDVVDYDVVKPVRRFPDLVAYFEHERKTLREIAEAERKAKLRRGLKTTRDAIVAVAAWAGHAPSPAGKKAALAILEGRLRGGNIPIEATIEKLADRKEADRFVEGLRRLRPMPEELAIDLATAATGIVAHDGRDEDALKAAAVIELFFAATPKSSWSQERRQEWLDAVLGAVRAATSAQQKDLAKRLSALARQHAPKGEEDVLDTAAITTVRQAIDTVLASGEKKEVPGSAKLARICGLLGASWPPHTGRMVERTIEEFSNPAESARFVAALRKLPVPRSLLESLAFAAVDRMQVTKVRPKAFPIADLFFDLAPAKPLRKDNRWISLLNNVIYWAVAAKNTSAALRFSELAMPHAGANANVPHNAACGLALSKRYDDALEMCRLAVKNRYKDLKKLQTDKLLGPLRDRDDFKALFAKGR